MALQRLDLRSARYDRLAGSVLIDARKCVVEISHDALEALARRPLKPDEAVLKAAEEGKRLARLATRLPADDGKIIVTRAIMLSDGQFGAEEGSE